MAEEVTRRLRTVCALYKQQCGWLVWLARSRAMRALACSGCRRRHAAVPGRLILRPHPTHPTRTRPSSTAALINTRKSVMPFGPARADRDYFTSVITGLSLALMRITSVFDSLSVAFRPKCVVFGGVYTSSPALTILVPTPSISKVCSPSMT